jgi:hypothetical protein
MPVRLLLSRGYRNLETAATPVPWPSTRPIRTAGSSRRPPAPFEAHGSRPSDSAIYRWEGSGPWQAIEGPLDSHVYALATGRGQLFAGLGDGTLLESDDDGESWSEGERIGGIIALAVQ